MNPAKVSQSIACQQSTSLRRGNNWPLRVIIAALALCVGVASWAQAPDNSSIPSGMGKGLPGVANRDARLRPNPLALRKQIALSQHSSAAAQPGAVAQTAAITANSATYTYVYINIPNSPFVQPNAINDFGLVVGFYADSSFNYHGFIWKGGTLQYLDYPGATETSLTGVNNEGLIAGLYADSSYNSHVVVYSPASGTWSELPALPGGQTTDYYQYVSLNDWGELAGTASDNYSGFLTWIWHPVSQSYSYLTAPEASESKTYGFAFNDVHTLLGEYQTAFSSAENLFLKNESDEYQTLILPANIQGLIFAPYGLNNLGAVVGTTFLPSGVPAAFIRSPGGVFTIVNDPAWPQTYLTGINDFGVLIGDVYNPTTEQNPGFIAYPQGWSAAAQHPQ